MEQIVTKRQESQTWWNDQLTDHQRIGFATVWYPNRSHVTLTGREIEYIHQKVVNPRPELEEAYD